MGVCNGERVAKYPGSACRSSVASTCVRVGDVSADQLDGTVACIRHSVKVLVVHRRSRNRIVGQGADNLSSYSPPNLKCQECRECDDGERSTGRLADRSVHQCAGSLRTLGSFAFRCRTAMWNTRKSEMAYPLPRTLWRSSPQSEPTPGFRPRSRLGTASVLSRSNANLSPLGRLSRCRGQYFVQPISFKRHRFPADLIRRRPGSCCFFRFSLSFRDVEELMAARSVDVSYETIRCWVLSV